MLTSRKSATTFTFTEIPYLRYVKGLACLLPAASLFLWDVLQYWLRNVEPNIGWEVVLIAIIALGCYILISASITTARVDSQNKIIYVMRNRWFHRAVLQYSFDEVSDGFYVNAMEANTDPESFVYDIRLRLKFSDDAILTSKTNSQWSAYTKTVLEANKYIQARAEARII